MAAKVSKTRNEDSNRRTGLSIPVFKPTERDKLMVESKPCHLEELASLHCATYRMREECDIVVENVLRCRTFWDKIKTDRLSKGIMPVIPPVSERDKVAAEYQKLLQPRKPIFDRPV